MSQNAKPAAATPGAPAAAPAGKPKKKMLMILGVVLLAGLAGGGGWFFSQPKQGANHVGEVKPAPLKPPIYVQLEPFTVNLQREGSDQYLQMGISLKVYEPDIEGKIKTNLPEIRSKVLQLLTTKTASELLSAEGKNKLVKEVISMGNDIIGIVNSPAASAAPVFVVVDQHGAASQVSAATAEKLATIAPTNAPAAAPTKGIIDVLFTSFIIQ